MRSGDLRHRITLESGADASGEGGLPETTWTPIATVSASIEPLSGSEQLRGMQLEASVSHRIRIRYRADLTAKVRAVKGGRVFDVRSVIDTEERHEELVLMADEVTA